MMIFGHESKFAIKCSLLSYGGWNSGYMLFSFSGDVLGARNVYATDTIDLPAAGLVSVLKRDDSRDSVLANATAHELIDAYNAVVYEIGKAPQWQDAALLKTLEDYHYWLYLGFSPDAGFMFEHMLTLICRMEAAYRIVWYDRRDESIHDHYVDKFEFESVVKSFLVWFDQHKVRNRDVCYSCQV